MYIHATIDHYGTGGPNDQFNLLLVGHPWDKFLLFISWSPCQLIDAKSTEMWVSFQWWKCEKRHSKVQITHLWSLIFRCPFKSLIIIIKKKLNNPLEQSMNWVRDQETGFLLVWASICEEIAPWASGHIWLTIFDTWTKKTCDNPSYQNHPTEGSTFYIQRYHFCFKQTVYVLVW